MAVLEATRLTGCSSLPSFISSGSKMIFNMPTSPTNWTKDTAPNSVMLRITNATTSPGGSLTFPQTFTNRPYSLSSTGADFGFSLNFSSNTPFSVTMPSTAYSATIGLQPASLSVAQNRTHTHPYVVGGGPGSTTRAVNGTIRGISTSPISSSNFQPAGQVGAHVHSYNGQHVHPFPTINSHTHQNVTTAPHSHSVSTPGVISGFSLAYVDFIISSKD
jgi:hypothetical protein